ncbi:PglL family O-oligosaccharyltransferase [Klebsiella michiganensis]|uniref:PglL family O-oligosaccharyltransferase n=1 Tax=Klebsiella michiganensis TaxID=1134687 RepID=UPI00388DA557
MGGRGVLFSAAELSAHAASAADRLWLIVAATLIQAVYALVGIGHPAWLPLPAQAAQRRAGQFAIGVFLQRNVTGSFIATGAAVLLWLAADARFVCRSVARERYRQWGSALGLGLLYATLTLLKSRTGWLGGVVCWLMMVTIFCFSPLRRSAARGACWRVVLAPVAGVLLGLALLSVSLLNALHEHDGSNLERVFILQQTWKMILQHPIVGWGYGGYAWSFAHFVADSVPPLSRRVPGLTYPHNDLLFWWVEGGAVALLGLLVLGVSGFRLLLRRPGVRQLALLACLMPILLHTQLEYPLYQSPVHWLLVLILVNLADRCPTGEQAPLSAFTAPSTRPVPCALMILACYGALLTGCAFWQGHYLTAFQQSPQRFASRVLRLHDIGIGSERLRKDRALSYIIRYQSSANVEDLEAFNQLGRRWIAVWNDADMYNNLINVERYLGQQKNARALREEARRLYPEDRRFSS